jgi:hypothetical protein
MSHVVTNTANVQDDPYSNVYDLYLDCVLFEYPSEHRIYWLKLWRLSWYFLNLGYGLSCQIPSSSLFGIISSLETMAADVLLKLLNKPKIKFILAHSIEWCVGHPTPQN